jgi:hypothetical protein
MANLPLAFGELLVGAIILDAGIKGDSIANVVKGQATQHPVSGLGTGASSTGAGFTGGGTGTYVNPIPGATPSRIDQGGDYILPPNGKFLAPGDSQIVAVDQRSGFGQYIAAKLIDGPLAGTYYYVAEGISPLVHVGQTVTAGTAIASSAGSQYGHGVIEAGWANSSNHDPLAQSLPGYAGDQSVGALTAGYSWSRFVQALGGVAAKFEGAGASLASQIVAAFASGHPAGVPYG